MGYWPLQMAIVDRSQTSDNMDRWKAEMGRVRGEKRSKRKSQKKEDPGARKGRKVAKHCVFPMICGSGGSKSRLAKVAGAEPAGQMKDETLHAVVAWSVFPRSDHAWKFGCRKSARRCGAKQISRSKDKKHYMFGQLLEVEVMKKCTQLWRDTFGSWDDEKVHAVVARSTFRGQNVESTTCSVWKLRCRFAWQAQGIVHLVKSEQTLGFCSISKNDGRRGTFEVDLARCIFCGMRSTRDTFIRVGGPGADFLRGAAFWSIRSSVLGRWFCVTGAALRMTWHHFFVAGAVL